MNPSGAALKMPLSLLDHSPFRSFFIPGLILLLFNGVLSLAVLVPVLRNASNAGLWVGFQGCVIFGWITVQVIMIRGLNWLHFLYWAVGLVLMGCGGVMRREARAAVVVEVVSTRH